MECPHRHGRGRAMLMPCFEATQAFVESIPLGQILAGYGELELSMCQCLVVTKGYTFDGPIREVFGKRGAEARIREIKKLLLADYTNAGLDADLVEVLDDMDWCREIRNQYAHCHWYWTQSEGLCFVNLEELAKQPTSIENLTGTRHPIKLPLLKEQEAFFDYVKETLWYLADAYLGWIAHPLAPKRPRVKPPKVVRPPLHN
jgi:hypothetical protein